MIVAAEIDLYLDFGRGSAELRIHSVDQMEIAASERAVHY